MNILNVVFYVVIQRGDKVRNKSKMNSIAVRCHSAVHQFRRCIAVIYNAYRLG